MVVEILRISFDIRAVALSIKQRQHPFIVNDKRDFT